MTALSERVGSREAKRNGKAGPGVSGLPQVNLLPPEVRASRTLRRTKRRLGLVLVGTLVLVGAGYGYALIETHAASSELAAAQQEAQSLQSKANKYAEVPQVLNQVNQVTAARKSAMTDDVVWRSYLDAITAVLPPNVSIDTLTVVGPDTMHAGSAATAATGTSALAATGIGTLTFAARSSTVPDAAALLDALGTVPGVVSPQVSAVTASASQSGTTYYSVTLQATLTSGALSHRFDVTGKS